MLNMKKMIIGVSAAILSSTAMAQNTPQLRADNIDEIVAAMTLEEKAQLLVGGGNDDLLVVEPCSAIRRNLWQELQEPL